MSTPQLTYGLNKVYGMLFVYTLLIAGVSLGLFLFFSQNAIEFVYVLNYSLTGYTFYKFLDAVGKRLAILEFIAFISTFQWIAVPTTILLWDIRLPIGFLPLAVSPEVYFSYALPATVALIAGLFFPFKYKQFNQRALIEAIEKFLVQQDKRSLPIILLVLGLVGRLISSIVPESIAFVFHLISEMIFVAVLYAVFSKSRSKTFILTIALSVTISAVIATGMFQTLVWWGVVMFMIVSLKYQLRFRTKLLLVIVGIFFLMFLQLLKGEFRTKTWIKNRPVQVEKEVAFFTSASTILSTINLKMLNEGFESIMLRSNQAYLSSMVLRHVPAAEPYAYGETIFVSLFASFVPRVIWHDKPISGGRENMIRFAGYTPAKRTSMDIAPLGDGYANFGIVGGIVFLFFYGFFISFILGQFLTFSFKKIPTLLLWCPFIFIQLLKAEVSVQTNFNAAIKGAIFVVVIFFIFRKVVKYRI